MRVTTAFNRMLSLAGASVVSIAFTDAGIVVGIRNTSRRLRCECGWSTRARYDTSVRRWRHVNLGKGRVWLEGEIRRLACKRCARVRTEDVAWARPGARHTRDYEDIVAWLVQRTDKTTTAPAHRCQIDHIQPWTAGGITSQDNGRVACGYHNRLRHRRRPPPP